jgi:hypothetical protein
MVKANSVHEFPRDLDHTCDLNRSIEWMRRLAVREMRVIEYPRGIQGVKLNSTLLAGRRRKVPAIALAIAVLGALLGLISYTGSGTASADEPSCTINECVSGTAVPDEATLREGLQTDENGAYFWTGRVDGQSVEADALRIANESGGTTLEGALADADITMPVFSDRTPEAIQAWELASRIFAEQASGDVFVVMGTEIRDGNVFQTLEFPTLQANQNVRRVIRMDNQGREVEVLFDRDATGDDPDDEPGNDPGNGNDDDEGDDSGEFVIAAQADQNKCVDSSEGENGARLTLRTCNGTIRQDFELDEGKLVAEFDRSLCLSVFPGPISSGGEFISEVKLGDCDSKFGSTWEFNESDGTWFSNVTKGCLSVADNRLEEAAEMFTQPCNGALRWSNFQ